MSGKSFTSFTVTADHLKLLREAYVSWDDMEFGAPSIDPKRPYGNSDVVRDIAEILGWDFPDEDDDTISFDEKYDEVYGRARVIHAETQTALQIFLRVGRMSPGEYRTSDSYSVDWSPVAG